ncbi:MAG: PCRF domain-containing protein, partial [Oscillospiraceae bacterium]
MFEKLNFVEEKYEDINNKLMDPTVISDNKQYKNLMKEYKNLTPIVEKYREYIAVKKDFDEAKSMLDEGGLD